jgi:predicted negative regulator of RcsB-dependent stress response
MADMTEDEQLVALKIWWRRYGWYITGGVLVGLVLYFSWSVWEGRQFEVRAAASNQYQTLLDQFIAGGTQTTEQNKSVDANVPAPYAVMEELLLAEAAVEQQQIDQAITQLQRAIKTTEDLFLQELATLRLARVYIVQNQAEEALALMPAGHKPRIDKAEWLMTRAKALTLLGKLDEARSAYGEVIVLYPVYSPQREMASMLLADLPA